MPDLGALLWPRTVALIGASADADSLRGRIFNVMRSHAFAGQLYPVSRSSAEVLGSRPTHRRRSAAAGRPRRHHHPAKHVPEELERCGKAGVKSAVVLSSGFAEAVGEEGSEMQAEIRAIAQRYGMAVMGPTRRASPTPANTLCPTFSPAMEAGRAAAAAAGRPRGQLAVMAQSGGIGFAVLRSLGGPGAVVPLHRHDRQRGCLEVLDFADFILAEGKTDALLLLLEDIKSPETFRRVAEKALSAGKPLIVNRSASRRRRPRSRPRHTAALAGEYAAYQAMFQRYGLIEGRDLGEMVDIAAGFLAWGQRLPHGRRVGICTASGGGGAAGWRMPARRPVSRVTGSST
jgi:acyl-CoA synthetase (NDP forming)